MVWVRAIAFLIALGCSPDKRSDGRGSVDTSGSPHTIDSGVVIGDSAQPDTGSPPPPIAGMPGGLWRDCRGTLGLDVSGLWMWRDAEGECVAEGTAELEAGVLTLTVSVEEGCEDNLPWWMTSGDDAPARHTFSVTDIRLTLVPEVALGSTGSASFNQKHFYGQLFRERWLLTNHAGQQSHFDACFSPERVFFEGRYGAIDEVCDFLSCGGAINEWRLTEEAQLHIWTQCAGGCPCAGVLQTSSFSETEMEGVYGYSNCAISGTGTFTGEQIPFPSGDAR
jgi:hypothetical protein